MERGELPLKAWKDCLRCPKFQNCDEIAVLRVLNPERLGNQSPRSRVLGSRGLLVQLPTVRKSINI